MEQASQDSVQAAREVCSRYLADAAYLVFFNAHTVRMADGSCLARVELEGEGYDAGGRDLGVGLRIAIEKNPGYAQTPWPRLNWQQEMLWAGPLAGPC